MALLQLSIIEAEKNIIERTAKITIVGLGKMGQPLVLVFTNAGFNVTGFDISEETVNMLNVGRTLIINEPEVQDRLVNAVANDKFTATINIEEAVKD
ncbi:hypothetical protein LCGC14_2282460, partial [marine sediment metagenome]